MCLSELMVFSGYLPRSGVTESYNKSIFSFLRRLHTLLQGSCISFHSHQQCRRVKFLIAFEQAALHFHFAMSSANDVLRFRPGNSVQTHIMRAAVICICLLHKRKSCVREGLCISKVWRDAWRGNFWMNEEARTGLQVSNPGATCRRG